MGLALHMETDGAAFRDPGREVARILRKLADRIEYETGTYSPDTNGGPLVDLNGNNVGEWTLALPRSTEEDPK